jgi:hypothetical protein
VRAVAVQVTIRTSPSGTFSTSQSRAISPRADAGGVCAPHARAERGDRPQFAELRAGSCGFTNEVGQFFVVRVPRAGESEVGDEGPAPAGAGGRRRCRRVRRLLRGATRRCAAVGRRAGRRQPARRSRQACSASPREFSARLTTSLSSHACPAAWYCRSTVERGTGCRARRRREWPRGGRSATRLPASGMRISTSRAWGPDAPATAPSAAG